MKLSTFLYILLPVCFIVPQKLSGQGESVDQITFFSSRFKNPVKVDVRHEGDQIYFNVINNAFFPYHFEVQFNMCSNLSPAVYNRETIVFPGTTRLFTFKIVDPTVAPELMYSTKYSMAASEIRGEPFNSYLVPVGQNSIVRFDSVSGNLVKKIYLDKFVMNPGDTVFCARKGIVTALPQTDVEIDRIFNYKSLEIRHEDGTIAVYFGLGSGSVFPVLGQTVYPGQPLGIIGDIKLLSFYVFNIRDEGNIIAMNISYADPDGKAIPASGISHRKIAYNKAVITKEMTKKESSKFSKGTLY